MIIVAYTDKKQYDPKTGKRVFRYNFLDSEKEHARDENNYLMRWIGKKTACGITSTYSPDELKHILKHTRLCDTKLIEEWNGLKKSEEECRYYSSACDCETEKKNTCIIQNNLRRLSDSIEKLTNLLNGRFVRL